MVIQQREAPQQTPDSGMIPATKKEREMVRALLCVMREELNELGELSRDDSVGSLYELVRGWLKGTKAITGETSAEEHATNQRREPEIHEKLDFILKFARKSMADAMRRSVDVFYAFAQQDQTNVQIEGSLPNYNKEGRDSKHHIAAKPSGGTRGSTKGGGTADRIESPVRRKGRGGD